MPETNKKDMNQEMQSFDVISDWISITGEDP